MTRLLSYSAANWIGHVLWHDCLLKTVLEGKMEGKLTGKPRRQMLDLLMEQEDKKISYRS